MNKPMNNKKRVFAILIAITITFAGINAPTVSVNARTNAPAKVIIKNTTQSKNNKKIVVTYKKIKKVTGYQVAYKKATAKKYITKKTKKTTYAVPAKKNTTYKIKVRAYKKTGKKTCYGKWSKVVTIKNTVEKHNHEWVTIVDKPAWDEPVYEEQKIYEEHSFWRDGTMCDEMDCDAKMEWCGLHCVRCTPDCPYPDPQGRCAFGDIFDEIICVGTEKVQVGTTHHEAVTHQECKTCGARK